MNVFFLGVLLWIPFIVVLTVTLLMFLLSGHKRGLWRSLISLGVTAVSAGLSLVLSKLIAAPIAALITQQIPMEDLGLPVSADFAGQLIQGLVGVTVSLLLFSVLLFMFCLIGKTLSNYLGDGKLMPKGSGSKWAGFFIRLADAVLFSLLLLLPLYGTLATYTPVAQAVITFADEDVADVEEFMDGVVEHPIVAASQGGPVGWVYDGLAEAQIGGSALDIADMAKSVSGLMEKMEALDSASEEEALPKTLELIDYLRTDVVEEDWCYELVIRQVLPEMKETLKEDIEDEKLAEELIDLLDMSQRDFQKNAHAILDFGEYLIKNDLVDADMDEVMASEEFMEEFGKVLNASEQTVGLKNLMIHGMLAEGLFDGDLEEARESLPLREKPADKDEYAQDARAFFTMMNAPDVETFREGLEMMPGAAAADPFQFFRF